MASALRKRTQTTTSSASRVEPTTSAKAPSKAAQARAEATPVATARVQCAYPIVLTLRANQADGEALWTGGPPSRPVLRFGDNAYSAFDAVAEAMATPTTHTAKRRRGASRTAAVPMDARASLEARVRLLRPGQHDDDDAMVVAGVTLSDLLDAITRYGRTASHICVARNAPWVAEALTRQSLSAPMTPPRTRPQGEASDMERMMRRLDRIVSEVASEMRIDDNVDSASSDSDIEIVVVDTRSVGDTGARPSASPAFAVARPLSAPAPTSDSAIAKIATVAMPALTTPPPTQTVSTVRPQSSSRDAARRSARKRQAHAPAALPHDAEQARPTKRVRRPTARLGSFVPQPLTASSSSPPVPSPRSTETKTSSDVVAGTESTGVNDDDHRTNNDNGADIDGNLAPQAFAVPCTIALAPCAQAPGVECSICMRDDGHILWDTASERPATLRDLWVDPGRSALVPPGTRLGDDAIVVNPCRNVDHAVCVGCMRAVLLNAGRPPVGLDRAAVGCVSLDGESRCAATSYGEACVFDAVLDASEAAHLATLYERHRFPGMEVVTCPLHIVVDRPAQSSRRRGPRVDVLPCGAECMVEHASASNAARGHLVVACTQNPQCGGSSCYHCRSRLPAGATRCGRCVRVSERDNPDGINRYFCRPALVASATKDDAAGAQPPWLAGGGGADAHLLRNREITEEVAVDQIERVLSMDRVAQPCYRCGVPLLKSTECNGLSHCGVQKCYMCGRNALAGGHLESDHWDADGATGCPRYDHHAYWRRMKSAPFVCSEGRCYNDTSECTVPAHRAGIEAMHAERRVWHVWGMLRSLSHGLGDCVMARLVAATRPEDKTRSLLLARVAKTLAQEAALARSAAAGTRS
nr:hypothetical protein [Pandoravirus massiliensis]